jgi:hypothetical protein
MILVVSKTGKNKIVSLLSHTRDELERESGLVLCAVRSRSGRSRCRIANTRRLPAVRSWVGLGYIVLVSRSWCLRRRSRSDVKAKAIQGVRRIYRWYEYEWRPRWISSVIKKSGMNCSLNCSLVFCSTAVTTATVSLCVAGRRSFRGLGWRQGRSDVGGDYDCVAALTKTTATLLFLDGRGAARWPTSSWCRCSGLVAQFCEQTYTTS